MCAASRFLTLIHAQDSVESPIAVSGYRWYPAWAFAGYAQGKKHSNDKQNLLCYKQRRVDVLRIVLRMLPFEFCCGQHYLSVLFVVRWSDQIIWRILRINVVVIRLFIEIQYVVKVKMEKYYSNYLEQKVTVLRIIM